MASARYGRVHSPRHVLAQKILVGPPFGQYLTPGGKHLKTGSGSNYLGTPTLVAYGVQNVNNSESHAIVDFQVGKDVGLGLFGRGTQSVFGFGARYVQMNTSSRANSHTLPDAQFHVIPNPIFQGKYSIQQTHYESALTMERYSNLHAIGPSLSLKNSTGLIGNIDDGEISLEWGANAAVLFGRQRTHVEHQTTTKVLNYANVRTAHTTGNHRTASRRVTIPNVGGFAAVSYRFTNAKISAGYRADFFFGSLDRGLDTRNDATIGFHGPFATVSFGLGG